MKTKLVLMLMAIGLVAMAQPAVGNHVQQLFNNGSGAVQYVCDAPAIVPQTSVSVAGTTLTNIIVATNVGTVTTASAHNLWPGAVVVVSGSATTALNASYVVATVPSSTTYTMTTSGVADATYTTGLVISTRSPLLNSATWFVSVLHYTSGSVDGSYPGGGSLSVAYVAKCSDRATY